MDSLLGCGKCKSIPPYKDALNLAEDFIEFFITKIQMIRLGEGFNIASVLCPIPFHVNEIKYV